MPKDCKASFEESVGWTLSCWNCGNGRTMREFLSLVSRSHKFHFPFNSLQLLDSNNNTASSCVFCTGLSYIKVDTSVARGNSLCVLYFTTREHFMGSLAIQRTEYGIACYVGVTGWFPRLISVLWRTSSSSCSELQIGCYFGRYISLK